MGGTVRLRRTTVRLQSYSLSAITVIRSDPIEWLPAIEQFGEGFFIHIDGLILRTGLEDQASKREQKSLEKGSLAEELRKMTHRVAGFRAWNMFCSIVLLMH